MSRASISIVLLLGTACGSDTEPSSAPPAGPATAAGGSTGSETAAAPVSSTSATTGGQSTTSSGNSTVESASSSETSSAQTSTASTTASAQSSTQAASTGGLSSAATTTTGEATPTLLSFANDIWPVWSMLRDPVFVYRGMGSYSGCTDVGVCHGGTNPGAGLSMPDPETAYAQLIDTPSVSSLCGGTNRVVVGDPENSCVILFYVGRLGREDLDWVDDAEIELMREWIRQGALP